MNLEERYEQRDWDLSTMWAELSWWFEGNTSRTDRMGRLVLIGVMVMRIFVGIIQVILVIMVCSMGWIGADLTRTSFQMNDAKEMAFMFATITVVLFWAGSVYLKWAIQNLSGAKRKRDERAMKAEDCLSHIESWCDSNFYFHESERNVEFFERKKYAIGREHGMNHIMEAIGRALNKSENWQPSVSSSIGAVRRLREKHEEITADAVYAIKDFLEVREDDDDRLTELGKDFLRKWDKTEPK